MGLFSFLRKKVRATAANLVSKGHARWMGRDATVFAREGYERNVIVYRCIDIISKSVASVPFVVKVNDEIVESHPILSLLERPNILQSGPEFIAAAVAYRLISGNAYIERLMTGEGRGAQPREMWIWTPYSMQVVARRDDRVPIGYVWKNGYVEKAWDLDDVTGSSDLLHWKTFNPLNHFYGLAPISAAAYSIDQHNAAGEWNMQMLQNGATPDGLLKTEKVLTDDQFKQLKQRMKEGHQGPKNAHEFMILEGGLDWTQTSLSQKDMDWLQGKNLSSQEIAAAFGVPTQVIPISGSQTFANYEQARLALWEDTVLPLLDNLTEEFNRWLSPLYPDKPVIEYDIDAIPALDVKRANKWVAIKDANFLTINEKRQELGYEPLGKDDDANPLNQIWLPTGLLPVTEDDGTDEPDPVAPTENEDELFDEMDKELQKILKSDLAR